jgi:hypothetical protein
MQFSSTLLEKSLFHTLENFVVPKQRLNSSSPSAFQVLEHHVVPLAGKNHNVPRRVFRLVSILVMHNLTSLKFTLEHFLCQQAMNANGLAVTPRSRVRIAFVLHGRILPGFHDASVR